LVLGSFAVVGIVGGRGDDSHDLEGYRGLGKRSPVLAVTFAVLLLAQAGAPFTTGFFAKFYVVTASVAAHSYALAVVAMLSAGIAAFFYLRVVFLMFGDANSEEAVTEVSAGAPLVAAGSTATLQRLPAVVRLEFDTWVISGLGIAVLMSVFFGIWPQPLISFAHDATFLFH
jgi:NADH-quinone oxidoreductase subunit N